MVKRRKVQAASSVTPPAASFILPSLYLGPLSAASNRAFLDAHGITHVLSIGVTPRRKAEGVTYHRLPLADSPTARLSKVADAACAIIDSATGGGAGPGKVLVHCAAGRSRSPSLVVAYLMTARGMSLRAARGRVVRARPRVSPNPGFVAQLKVLDEELHGVVSLEVDELPRREEDRLALFVDGPEVACAGEAAGTASDVRTACVYNLRSRTLRDGRS